MLRFPAASSGATGGRLTIMAAAPAETFEAAKPVLDAIGDKLFRVGERPGQGAMVKTVNQLLCGVHIAVVAEAFSLAAKVGVDRRIDARDPERLRRVELDAEGPRPPHARRPTRR